MKTRKYIIYWQKITILSLQSMLATRGAALMYISGKFIRFFFFLALLLVVLGQTKTLAGFDIQQMIIFFLIFNLLDMIGQVFFRGIYWFRNEVVSGKFDLTLTKPINPLFQVLISRTDLLDVPLLVVVIWLLFKQNLNFTVFNLALFFLMALSGFLIVLSVHILVAAVGVFTTEVDNSIQLYRDLSLMARVPIDIYIENVRGFLTFVLPIAVVFTFPAKALMNMLAWPWVVYSILASIFIFMFSLKFWHFALTKYASASS